MPYYSKCLMGWHPTLRMTLLTVFTVTDKAAGQPGLQLLGDSNERLYLGFALQTLLERGCLRFAGERP
ncbi:hypothetical protein AGJ02_11845 [Cronobacter sakazakii]|nr:hypothetical protein [Cronobacter sakazakii]KAB0819517.1 hypothetical protein AGJ08_07765 [Cronobacter sakazakii]KAB0826279.1 hypothetical protein AGJ49_15725 [Cronobacter sakazakii]KAB0833433.1 hypothetical protein AGJ02_11845 [Cronobacter sakazakii]KAB0867447.1 hypothetical protein FZH98_10600 [Cronobacter sakazakii]